MAVAESIRAGVVQFGIFNSSSAGSNLSRLGDLFRANAGGGPAHRPSSLDKCGVDYSEVKVVHLEIGHDNSEDVAAAAEEWNVERIPVVISPKEYIREPMFGQDDDQTSMFGLPAERAYRFAKGSDGGFMWCATEVFCRKLRKFYNRSRLVQILDKSASLFSQSIMHRSTAI